MPEQLGPLELAGDRWVIGDSRREGNSWLVLAAKGLEHYEYGASRAVVPWDRFVELDVRATQWAWMASPGWGLLGSTMLGRSACSVEALVRHPYDMWSARYTHHKRAYTYDRLSLVQELFRKTVEAKAAQRLGDPQWLSEAVAQLASADRSVDAIIEDLRT